MIVSLCLFFLLSCTLCRVEHWHDNSPTLVELNTYDLTKSKIPSYIKKKKKKNNNKHMMVVYVDKEDCPLCFVSQLSEWEIFMKECKKKNISLNFMFIFNPSDKEKKTFINALSSSSIADISYIDDNGSFRRKNQWLINNPSKHIFIIDNENIPVFMGPPPYDKETESWLRSL